MKKEVIELSLPASSLGTKGTELEASLGSELGSLVEPSAPLAGKHGLACRVRRENLFEVMQALRDGNSFLFSMLVDITAVDWFDRRETRFEVVYQLLSLTYLHRMCIKVPVPEDDPVVRSVTSLWPAAIFLEREVWDMFGVRFEGHPDLRRILMYDEFVGHPLRKDYPIRRKQPRVPLRVPELRNTSADMQRSELGDE